jgi:hypothetical protein
LKQLFGRLEAGDEWNVRGADASVGEVEAGDAPRDSRDAEEHDIGLIQVLHTNSIVVSQREVNGVDPVELLTIQLAG